MWLSTARPPSERNELMQLPASPPEPDTCARCGAPATLAWVPEGKSSPAAAFCGWEHNYGRRADEIPDGIVIHVPDVRAAMSDSLVMMNEIAAEMAAGTDETPLHFGDEVLADLLPIMDLVAPGVSRAIRGEGVVEVGGLFGDFMTSHRDGTLVLTHTSGATFDFGDDFVFATPPFHLPKDLPSRYSLRGQPNPPGSRFEMLRYDGTRWNRDGSESVWLAAQGELRCGQDGPDYTASTFFGCGDVATVAVAAQDSRSMWDLVAACATCVDALPGSLSVAHTWGTWDGGRWTVTG